MADLSIFEKYPGSFRLDHPDFGDVSKTTFAKGVITAFYEDNSDDPVVVKDVCDLEVDGQEFQEVPIFYHVPKSYAENWKLNPNSIMSDSVKWKDFWGASGNLMDKDGEVTDLPEGGMPFDGNTIARGVYSFSVGDEVAVMLKEGVPIGILGFADGVPRRPFDYVKVEMPPQVLDSDNPENVGDPHCPYILQLSDSGRVITPSGPNPGQDDPIGLGLGPDGLDLNLLKDAKIFPDKVAYAPPGGGGLNFYYDYECFYGSAPTGDPHIGGNIVLDPNMWETPPDPNFGPFFGYMNFGVPPASPWADYLDAWLTACDTIQTINSWAGLWPAGLGRPSSWIITAQNPNDSPAKYVMRTYLIETGPMLFLIRVFYQHTKAPPGDVAYWQNRIAWPYDGFPPPTDWSGYSYADTSNWTPPMWAFGSIAPAPTTIGECFPPPDGYMSSGYESFYGSYPHYIYAAPASRDLLDNIEGVVAASNAGIDVSLLGSVYPPPPQGFRNIFGNGFSYSLPPGFIPPVGNLRELNFRVAARIGA